MAIRLSSHSASPAYAERQAMAALGLNWRYLAFDVHSGGEFSARFGKAQKAMRYVGINLDGAAQVARAEKWWMFSWNQRALGRG